MPNELHEIRVLAQEVIDKSKSVYCTVHSFIILVSNKFTH